MNGIERIKFVYILLYTFVNHPYEIYSRQICSLRFGIQAMYYKVRFTLCSFETKMSLLRPKVVFTYLW